MEKRYDVICIGQVVQDILVTNIPEDALTCGKDTFLADEILMSAGGDAANEASVLAKLGSRSALLTRLDKKEAGNMIFDDLSRQGVDTSLLIRPEDCRTFTAIVVVKPDGSHIFFDGPGHNFTPKLSDVDLSVFGSTRFVTAGSLYALGELDGEGIAKIFRAAQEAGAVTVADMNFDSEGKGPQAADPVYPHTDYLMPSYDEAVYVTGEREPERIADYFLARGVGNVVLKLGGEGCFFKNRETSFYTDPYQVAPVDTTGCGDNFVAAFVHGLLKGMSHEETADFACAAGALNSLGLGAHSYIQSEEQVVEFMRTGKKNRIKRA